MTQRRGISVAIAGTLTVAILGTGVAWKLKKGGTPAETTRTEAPPRR